MDKSDTIREIQKERLHIPQFALPCRPVTDMADGHLPGQRSHILWREHVLDESEVPHIVETRIIIGKDAGSVLSPVLKKAQSPQGS
jgi:hypothetical protein